MNLKPIRVLAVILSFGSALAHASLIIDPTFDSSITSNPNAASIEGAINAAIGVMEADLTNSITVQIYFTEGGGLGGSDTSLYGLSYYDYYNALKALDTSAAQLTALASLGAAPTGENSGNPVNGGTEMALTSANLRALGFTAPGGISVGSGYYDSEISLNTSITSPPNSLSGYYGLQAVAAHEIDEALGIGGPGSTLGQSYAGTYVGPLDLYRYSAPGVRSYSTFQTTSPYSYFSINGGTTVLSYFNQISGADYADWMSNPIPPGFSPQVQDAFGQSGTNPALGVNELTALNVEGYNLAPSTPEPSTLPLMFLGLTLGCGLVRRIRGV